MDEPANEPVQKAHRAMDHLLMAYSAMMEYTFEGAIELRAATMEVIHALESLVTVPPGEPVVIDYGYDEEDYKKEIVAEDGQFCVYNADRSRSFGCYMSRERAEERLEQIEQFAKETMGFSDKALMAAYIETNKQLSSQTLAVVNEIIDEELTKRLNDDFGVTGPSENSYTTVIKADQRYTLGPVYVPGAEDAHGETIDAHELQESIWEWVRKGDRTIYLQHSEKPAGEMVEILTMPFPIETSLVVPNEGVTKYSFPADTPFMGVIWEEWAWDLVKAGKLRGYSIGGQAKRVEVELPEELAI